MSTHGTQTVNEHPAVYIVVERWYPEDYKGGGGKGFRVLDVFPSVELANDFAKKYAEALVKMVINRAAKRDGITPEEVQSNEYTKVTMRAKRDTKRHTHQYAVSWRHETWIGVAKYPSKDTVPDLSGRIKYLDWSDCIIKHGDYLPPPESWPRYCDDGWSEDENKEKEKERSEKEDQVEGLKGREDGQEKQEEAEDSDEDDYDDFFYDGWLWSGLAYHSEDIELKPKAKLEL